MKIIIKEENFKWHLEAFASELFISLYNFDNGLRLHSRTLEGPEFHNY